MIVWLVMEANWNNRNSFIDPSFHGCKWGHELRRSASKRFRSRINGTLFARSTTRRDAVSGTTRLAPNKAEEDRLDTRTRSLHRARNRTPRAMNNIYKSLCSIEYIYRSIVSEKTASSIPRCFSRQLFFTTYIYKYKHLTKSRCYVKTSRFHSSTILLFVI